MKEVVHKIEEQIEISDGEDDDANDENSESENEDNNDSENEYSSSEEIFEEEEEDIHVRTEWYFESYDYDIKNSFVDTHIFWWSQAAATLFWSIFLVINTLAISLFWVRLTSPKFSFIMY